MNEDFVPFQIAKKLKEKGFNWICSHYYRTNSKDLFKVFPCEDWSDIKERINAPTIPKVLKWLREEKKIHILIDVRMDLSWLYEIWGIEISLHPLGCVPYQKHQSYELAALAGIEYVIDNNLI